MLTMFSQVVGFSKSPSESAVVPLTDELFIGTLVFFPWWKVSGITCQGGICDFWCVHPGALDVSGLIGQSATRPV